MSNAILEYAKLAGQLDCKTNQQLNKAAGTNRRKREFASVDEPEAKGNFVDRKHGKPVEKNEDETDGETIIKEKKSDSASKGERKASRQVDGDIGELSEQMDNLESDLKPKRGEEKKSNDIGELNEEDDCKAMPSGDLDGSGQENDKIPVNKMPMNGLPNGDCLEEEEQENDEYASKEEHSTKDGEKEQTDFKSFYSANRLNDKHGRPTGKYRAASKRLLIRSGSNESGQQPQSTGSSTASLNSGHRSSSNSPNDGLNGTTRLLTTAGSSGNDSYTFEDNLADENRCSSTTSSNSGSNNGLAGENRLILICFTA